LIEAFPNELIKLEAKVGDQRAASMLKLKSIELINSSGQLVKSLNASQKDGIWTTGYSFPVTSKLGTYEVKWNWSFNGQPVVKQEFINLHKDFTITTNSAVALNSEQPLDDTLPPDLQYLAEVE
jgi:hypothetical protein